MLSTEQVIYTIKCMHIDLCISKLGDHLALVHPADRRSYWDQEFDSQVKVSAYLSLPLKFRDLENIDRTTRSVNALFD